MSAARSRRGENGADGGRRQSQSQLDRISLVHGVIPCVAFRAGIRYCAAPIRTWACRYRAYTWTAAPAKKQASENTQANRRRRLRLDFCLSRRAGRAALLGMSISEPPSTGGLAAKREVAGIG